MARAVFVLDLGIVLFALVDILDHKRDGRSGRNLVSARPFDKHAGKNLDLVGLASLAGKARLTGTSLVQIGLDVGFGERNTGRAAIDHGADCRPVTLAECRHSENMAECIE